jgi:hypothetical protein
VPQAARGSASVAGKHFFFEKKTQKTSIPPQFAPENKSFLVLFFKKELLPYLLRCR